MALVSNYSWDSTSKPLLEWTPMALESKIEKVPRCIQGEKPSKDMASSSNLVSTIGAKASPKKGNGTRCPDG